jgi:hypothetical protein
MNAYEFDGLEVEYHDNGIDWRRVMVETMRAGIVPRGSLRFRRDDEADAVLVLDVDLGEIHRIARWRVASFDPENLRPYAGHALDQLDEAEAWRLVGHINAGNIEIIDDPEHEHVLVHVDGFKLCAVHRRCLVPGYRG